MANVSNIRPLIVKWEGGLSRHKSDTASALPAPWTYNGYNDWHTNKGVTYATFLGLAPKIGYSITPDNFFTMPDTIWDAIFKVGYWNPWNLDELKSQAIADIIVCFAWGSGVTGSFNSIKKYLATKGINVSNTSQAVDALNKISFLNEKKIFEELISWREQFFKSLNQPIFLRGWLNRLNDIKQFGLNTIKKKRIKIGIAVAVILIVSVACVYFVTKK